MIKTVTKRDGTVVSFDPSKLNKWAKYAAGTMSWSDIAMKTAQRLYDGAETTKVHDTMISVCEEKGTVESLKMAATLFRAKIDKVRPRRRDFQDLLNTPEWRLFAIPDDYMAKLFDALNKAEEEYYPTYEYSSLVQWWDKYALKRDGVPVERPVETIMGISLALFPDDLDGALEFFKHAVARKINIATPIMASARTRTLSGASCCVITAGDSLGSITAANMVAYNMTANRAGIGFEYDTRSIGDDVGNGKCGHAGKLPHYNMLLSTIKSVKQGVRGGAATVSFNVLDPELLDLLKLKLPTTPSDKRINLLDYSLVTNNEFWRRVAKGEDWTLVSKRANPELHKAFYEDPVEFTRLLEKGSVGHSIPAREIAAAFIKARQETGRVYLANVDNMNSNTPFKEPIRQSNLCLEVGLPTREYDDPRKLYTEHSDDSGTVAICTLMAIDVFKTDSDADYDRVAYIVLKALDNLIDMQSYPYLNIETSTKNYRSVGVGITGLASLMACNNLKYSSAEGKKFIDYVASIHWNALDSASARLADERGDFGYIHKTKLKNRRFSTLVAHMPCESSSMFTGTPNGVYPIREEKIVKSRGEGTVTYIAPQVGEYELAWDIPTKDLYECYAILQKYCDQSISADTYIDYSKYPDGKVPMSETLKNILFAMKSGVKTLYYLNSRTGATTGVASKLREESDCESCTL